MKTLEEIKGLITEVSSQIEKYEANPTKAESRRIRNSLNSIKKLVTPAKAELLEADKAGK